MSEYLAAIVVCAFLAIINLGLTMMTLKLYTEPDCDSRVLREPSEELRALEAVAARGASQRRVSGGSGGEMSLERATLELLEKLHTRYVCMTCGNRGHEGKHEPSCEFFSVLKAWREKAARG